MDKTHIIHKRGLTEVEIKLIIYYTANNNNIELSVFRNINLRLANRMNDLKKWAILIYHLMSGIKKLEPIKQRTYRR